MQAIQTRVMVEIRITTIKIRELFLLLSISKNIWKCQVQRKKCGAPLLNCS